MFYLVVLFIAYAMLCKNWQQPIKRGILQQVDWRICKCKGSMSMSKITQKCKKICMQRVFFVCLLVNMKCDAPRTKCKRDFLQ